MMGKFTGQMTTSSLILAILLISVTEGAILPENFGSPTIAADFQIPSFPDIKLPTLTLPTMPTIPTIPTIPTPTMPSLPVIPTPTMPSLPVIPTPTMPSLPVTSAIPLEPCGMKPFCGQAANFKTQAQMNAIVEKNCPIPQMMELKVTATAATAATAALPSKDFSGTNNQEARVDEADILKTDGNFIYSVSGKFLSIIRAFPTNQTRVMSRVELKGNPGSLFIDGNYLTVFGTDYEQDPSKPRVDPIVGLVVDPIVADEPVVSGAKLIPPYYLRRPFTWVLIYDISNRATPKQIKKYMMAGSYSNGRKSEETGFVYLLSSQDCRSSDSSIPWYNFGNGKKNMTLSQIFYYPVPKYNSVTFTNLLTFNLRNPMGREENAISFLTLSSWIIYMSEKFLYLTSSQWTGQKVNTKIHKVYVFRSRLIPMADGSVPGSIQKQFNLDEYNYDLRIATTQWDTQGNSLNNVFCLDFSLKIIGSVRKIAPNQTIFSARYVDTRLYLVTFRQIDPFFVIDLSNHSLPKVLGQLKITGFSNYLHPYDARTIIGFGRETNEQGVQTGLKVSLFDVSDVKKPRSLADYVLPLQYSYSTAQWEHKAFLFSMKKNLMVVPASYYNWQANGMGPKSFNGAMVFQVKRNQTGGSIKLRAIVNHLLNSKDNFWNRGVERSLYIDNILYTKSPCLLRAHRLEKLDRVLNLNLNCESLNDMKIAPIAPPVFNPPAPLQISGTIPVV